MKTRETEVDEKEKEGKKEGMREERKRDGKEEEMEKDRGDDCSDKKKIEELRRQLTEERRASKKAIGKLQSELQRQRGLASSSSIDARELLQTELDKERMMRLGTEQRLQDVQLESDSCRMRLQALQEEFRKMEEMVANMLQYKAKIDQLKQENASMKSSYETNLQKYCSHISTLERDNMMLRNQVKKMETQLHGKGDERDKSKLFLERLKMVEAENSSLVLENEQQRQQYEKCLDEIANQVVQALLAQKTLREECLKLQTRVHDLELQNKHLNIMFQQRMKHNYDSGLKNASSHAADHVCEASIYSGLSTTTTSQEEMTLDFLGTASSLQSMCSEIIGDDSPGKPQMSSPPPWLRDKLRRSSEAEGDTSPSSTTSSISTASPPAPDTGDHIVQTKIETEFPATNSSPKVKHICVYERRARSLERGISNPFSWARRSGRGGNRNRRSSDSSEKRYSPVQRLKQSTSADAIINLESRVTAPQSKSVAEVICWSKSSSSQDRVAPQTLLQSLPNDDSPAVFMAGADFNHKSFEAFNKSFEKLLAKNSSEDTSSSASKPVSDPVESVSVDVIKSTSCQKQRVIQPTSSQTSTVIRKAIENKSSASPILRHPNVHNLKSPKSPANASGQYYYYDYSDEDSDSRPVSRDFSMASTMSLNELLDSSAEGEVALDDEFFSDWSSVYISPKKKIDCLSGISIFNSATESKHRNDGLSSSLACRSMSSSPSPDISGIQHSLKVTSSRDIKSKLASTPSVTEASTDVSSNSGKINKNIPLKPSTKESECDKSYSFSKSESQANNSGNLENTATEKLNCPEVAVEILSEEKPNYFLPSPSPSPNLSQKSQDLGYASKGSYTQSSSSPSPSIPHRSAPFWLQNTKDPHSFSRNELLTLVVSRETMGIGSTNTSNCASSSQTSKLTRPGQLILVPQDKSYNFQGFSSASSTSSEDKSPMKMFESRQNSDMKSSVIEVKKDGTFVHNMNSLGDSSSENSSSLSASPCSPVKIPSKVPPPVAKKPTRLVGPETRPSKEIARDNTNETNKFPGSANTNITVGFLLNNQIFPEKIHSEAVESFIRSKTPSNQPQEPFNHFQTKCQSSDSSFENLRVERSGSKDDGYSTMSSDIHPEVLERFSDTLSHKILVNECEPQTGVVKNAVTEIPAAKNETRRNSDPTIHNRDRSFDLTSDPDSALETSVHSTAEMVTSSSSQVSTSSSDYPFSPCSSNVSKIAQLFDGENTKLNFAHGGTPTNLCRHKDTTISSSSRTSSNSSSPVSPNAFIPSCYQPPESPRRLAIEFQKLNVKSPGSPAVLRKTSPESPKHLNKSFGGFSHLPSKQQQPSSQSESEIQEVFSEKIFDAKKPTPMKPPAHKTPASSAAKSLPKGFYSSVLQKAKNVNRSSIQMKTQTKLTSASANEAGSDQSSMDSKSETIIQAESSQLDNKTSHPAITSDLKITSLPTPKNNAIEKDKQLTKNILPINKSNTKLSKSQPKCYAKSTSNTLLCDKKKGMQNQDKKLDSNIVNNKNANSNNSHKDVLSDNVALVCSDISKCSHNDVCVSCNKTVACSNHVASLMPSNVNSSHVFVDYASSKSSTQLHCGNINNDSSSSFLSKPALSDISFNKSQLHYHHTPSNAAGDHVDLKTSINQPLKHHSQIIMTNQGFQQFSSDSDNNDDDDDSASLPSITFDDNFLEDIPEENDSGDTTNAKDFNSNLKNNNNTTTNTFDNLPSTNSERAFSDCNELNTDETVLKSSKDALTTLSSIENKHQLHQGQYSNQSIATPKIVCQNITSISSNKVQCLHRSKSEHNISNKSMSTSSYDDFFGLNWNCRRVLERSVSVSELDLLPQRSWLYDGSDDHNQQWKVSNMADPHQELSRNHGWTHCVFLPPHSSSAGCSSNQNNYHQPQFTQQRHPQQSFYNQQHHSGPWVQSLRFDLSDVTELDEDGSELATTRDSLDSSHQDIVNDESPRCDVDEQKRFNSQFYSLCKVDSNRSLLSSCNESKERLSMTSLNEILNSKSFENPVNILELNSEAENEEDDIAIREFDEISRQIASLSKTVDLLNQSLSSLNSGEFESSSHKKIESSSFKQQEIKSRSRIIDGYHWADDEFFMTSCNDEINFENNDLVCNDSFGEIFTNNSSFDLNSTEDAAGEFYQVPLRDHQNPFACRNSAGQDDIFAGSFYDTVKEKPVKKRKKQFRPRSGSDGNLKEKTRVAEKRLSVPTFHKSIQDEEVDTRKERRDEVEDNKIIVSSNEQGSDQTDKLTGSNNDSDDSLASDIGLDHMMCQRLFGRKGRFQSSSSHNRCFIEFKHLFMRYGDSEKEAISAFNFLDSVPFSENSSRKQISDESIFSNEVENTYTAGKVSNSSNENHTSVDTFSSLHQEIGSKQMRDVGVDAMSQSQQSMNASFETFDQSLPDLEITEISSKSLNEHPNRCGSYSLSETSLSQSFGNCDNLVNDKIDAMQKYKNLIDLSNSSAIEIVAHGGCDVRESRPQHYNLNEEVENDDITDMAGLMTYSDFVANLKYTSAVVDSPPPKLPPRRPIITSCNMDQDIAPLPPPPPCLDNGRFHPLYNQHLQNHEHHHHHHASYVNQIVPVLDFHISNNYSSQILSNHFTSEQPVDNTGNIPPPLPPRQPQIIRTEDSRPQVLIRPQRIHQDKSKSNGRPHSFNHYLIHKSKPALSSPPSPANVSTYPRSRSHSETSDFSQRTPSMEKLKDETSTSRIPRRKLKTRRERSQLKQTTEKPSNDASTKLANSSGSLSNKHWQDISLANGMPMSDSSCEDNISS